MKKLIELRKEKKLTQSDLAVVLGISRQAYSNYEAGKRQPDNETMLKLAEYFNVSVDYLLGRDDKPVSVPPRKGIRVPVYGEVAAGLPIEAIENFDSENPDDWEEISEDMARSGDFFALRIHGDSMEPKISSGDIVIVRIQPDVENGETAIVKVNGDTATCKKIKKTPQGLMLISTNPDYEPMFYSKQEVNDLPVVIIGKVVELRAKF